MKINIHDVDVKALQEKYKDADKFETMLKLQSELAAKYGVKIRSIDTKAGQQEIKDKVFCCVEELFEMTNTLKNRAWAKTEVPVDRGHFQDELADAMAFFFEVLILSNMSPDELFEIYLKKMKVNEFRQRSNY